MARGSLRFAGRRFFAAPGIWTPPALQAQAGRPGMVAGVLQTVFLILMLAGFGLVAWAAGYVAYRVFQGQP